MHVNLQTIDHMCYNGKHSRHWLPLQGSFSSPEEKETFLSRYEAARLLLAPGERYYHRVVGPRIDTN